MTGDLDSMRGPDWKRFQKLIGEFETAWNRGERPRIADHLPAGEPRREALLVELVHAELEFRIKAGEPARVEEYFERYRGLARDRETVLGLIRAEWRLRRRSEPKLSMARYRQRFPDYADEFESRLLAEVTPGVMPAASAGPEARSRAIVDGPLPRKLGKYELRQRIGAGSFGIVYRAWDSVLNRQVALKLPRPEAVSSPSDLLMFLREARNAKDLRHPNIVEILDAGPIEGTDCVVRAYIEGTTLAERLTEASVSPTEAASLMIDVTEALEHAHGRGIIHRDLKPSNILLDRQGRPHLTDFGLAKRDASDTTLSPLGLPGPMIGTPAYMSPEQARGEAHKVDARSDVYSAGVVLYELLTGSVPFPGRGRILQVQIEGARPTPPRSLNDDVPRDLESICLNALAKLPSARYASAREMGEDLRNFLGGRPVASRHVDTPGKFRRLAPAGMIAALAVGMTLGCAAALLAERHRRDHARAIEQAIRSLEELEALPYIPNLAGPDAHRRFLEAARARSTSLVRSVAPGGDPSLGEALARSSSRLAEQESSLGSDRDAVELWQKAVDLAESVARARPADPSALAESARALTGLALVRGRLGDAGEATRLHERALEHRDRVREIRHRQAEGHPDDLEHLLAWAWAEAEAVTSRTELGRPPGLDEAERLAALAADWPAPGSDERRGVARLYLEIARDYLRAQDFQGARKFAHKGLDFRQESLPESGAAVDRARLLMVSATASRQLGHHFEARDDFEGASRRYDNLVLEDPIDVDLRRDRAASHHEFGRLLADQPERLIEAIEELHRALEIRTELRREHPMSHADLADLGATRSALGLALAGRNRWLGSAVNHARAIACDVGAIALAPGVPAHRRDLLRHVDDLARMIRSRLDRL